MLPRCVKRNDCFDFTTFTFQVRPSFLMLEDGENQRSGNGPKL